jgi:hypothetical protein
MASSDAPERFVRWREGQGATDEVSLPCVHLVADALLMCFRVREGDRRRWVTSSDLTAWDVDLRGVLSIIRDRSAPHATRSGALMPAEGMERSFWQGADGSGWEPAVFLHPGAMARRLETSELLVSAPSTGVVLAWGGGDAEMDLVMAVGTREMWQRQAGPVSPLVYRWARGTWAIHGEAVAEATESEPKKNATP